MPRALARRLCEPVSSSPDAAIRWLTYVIALHDLGKASPAFQAKAKPLEAVLRLRGFDFDQPANARDHGTLGVPLARGVLLSLGLAAELALPMARAVAAHHGTFPADEHTRDPGKREGGGEPWRLARARIVSELEAVTRVRDLSPPPVALARDHAFFVLLAGLTAVSDWIGSMADVFRYVEPPASLADYVAGSEARVSEALARAGMFGAPQSRSRTFKELFGIEPWPLHRAAERIATGLPEAALVIIEAPMGEGKTEAALLLAENFAARAGHGGLYIGLPTQATANQMLGRVERFLRAAHPREASNLHLAHGEASLDSRFGQLLSGVHANDDDPTMGSVRAERWFTRSKRTLLATHAVGTIDQGLLAVLRARHGFVRLYGLAGKVVILDEVHAYDTFTSTLLERLVEWLRASGASVILLSATLPSARRRSLVRAAGSAGEVTLTTPYPRVTVVRSGEVSEHGFLTRGHALQVMLEPVDDDIAAVARQVASAISEGGCAGWICNTVARAQSAFLEVKSLHSTGEIPVDTVVLLLHGRLLSGDRSAREKLLEGLLGRLGDRPLRAIVVGTQVMEQSLDVDFDIMATDVAPMDLILQRIGRLHRHDRAGRPAGLEGPRVIMVGALGAPLSARIDRVAGVYLEVVMRRTLLVLEGRTAINLPADIESLVSATYDPTDPPEHAEELAKLRRKAEDAEMADGSNARQRILPSPSVIDDPLGSFGLALEDDDDAALHQALRAITRLGPPSIDVVCLHALSGGGVAVDPGGSTPIDLAASPPHSIVESLLRQTVGISTRGLASMLIGAPAPKGWSRSSLLRHRRALVLKEGAVDVGSFHLRLDDELGLVIERVSNGGRS